MLKIRLKNLAPEHKLRAALALALIVLAAIFLYLRVVPGGRITYSRTWPRGLASGQGFIYDFKPGERMDLSDPNLLKMTGDPLYFSLFTPRGFDRARVTVRYASDLSLKTPIIEVGVLKDKVTGSYDLQPLENKLLDNLPDGWTEISGDTDEGRLVLFQREAIYDSVVGFVSDLEQGSLRGCPGGITACLATYNYPFTADYQPPVGVSVKQAIIDQPLRGAHRFLVYLPAGAWNFNFRFVDLNLDRAADPITVTVTGPGSPAPDSSLADPNPDPTGGQSEDKELTVSGKATEAGIYKVEIKVSDDIVISRISSPSDRLVFLNRIWPVSSSGPLRFYTDAGYLQARTLNPASLGAVTFGGQRFSLDATYRQFDFSVSSGDGSVILEHDDVVLENGGVFALSPGSLFNPSVPRVDRFFKPSAQTRYILARYVTPAASGAAKEASAELDLRGASREDGSYSLLISVPGLGTDTEGSWLRIDKIEVELAGKTLWQKLTSWTDR